MSATIWKLDPSHTTVTFSVRHMMMTTVRGSFATVEATLTGDTDKPADAQVQVQITTASINTNETNRDNHLRSADFFESEKYPHMTFSSKKIEVTGESSAKITGDLTIRDVTREIVLDAEYLGIAPDLYGNTRVGFSATGKLNREDFGLTWNMMLEAGGVLVGKEVKLEIDAQFIKVAVAEPA